MLVHFRREYKFLRTLFLNHLRSNYTFDVPLNENILIKVIVNVEDNSLSAMYSGCINDGFYKFLSGEIEFESLTKSTLDELIGVRTQIDSAVKKLLSSMKYFFSWYDFDNSSYSSKSFQWSDDCINWSIIKIPATATVSIEEPINLTTQTQKYIQDYLNGKGWEPFYALDHLHKAKNERIPKYKWIYATIAAELAIKEFYIRLLPDVKNLLLEMPSPPLHKLYGDVMKSYIGVKSPKITEISKGVNMRNMLMHRPHELSISDEEADKYVADIEYAIFHLLSILYSKDDYIINLHLDNVQD